MDIASQLRKDNIAEYLLFMWQIEDFIRANKLDLDAIRAQYPQADKELMDWYESMIDMMRREDVTEKGHLQINKNTLSSIVDLHRKLLDDPKFDDYQMLFRRTLPYIIELRAKAGDNPAGEIETCFNLLYLSLMLRLQGKELSEGTAAAVKQISAFIAQLAANFAKDERGELFDDNEES
ncbi:MAG: DUF4924 family protein [Muribaculaceae bacterium]|nr:DUF4924 family protein [Muribaculaceae bacterium]